MSWLSRLFGLHSAPRQMAPESLLNDALDVALEWDKWLSPIQGRLHAMHPHLSKERLDELNHTCHSAVRFGLEIALRLTCHCDGDILKGRFDVEFCERYPWLNEVNKERMFRHSIYHATKTARTG